MQAHQGDAHPISPQQRVSSHCLLDYGCWAKHVGAELFTLPFKEFDSAFY